MSFDKDEHQGFILLRVDNFIWHNPSLCIEEKIFLNLCFGFAAQGKCMFASDEWIGFKFGWEPKFVFEMTEKLRRQGYIKVNRAMRGGARAITFIVDTWEDPCQEETEDGDIFSVDPIEIIE
jgi:hypothetical protein